MPTITMTCGLATFVHISSQSSARPLILFKTKTKTCLEICLRPTSRLVLIWNVQTNTKTSLDIGNNWRPVPRVLVIDMFETNTMRPCLTE